MPATKKKNPATAPGLPGKKIKRSGKDKTPSPDSAAFPVVGIGASAGGLAALTDFLKHLPAKTGIAFVLAQHRSRTTGEDILIELLQKNAAIEVVHAEDGALLRPDRLLIPPPGKLMGVFNGKLQIFEHAPVHKEPLPIDFFLRSLAEDQNERASAIILSGSGSDGSLGVKSIKEHGGMVMAQSPESAEFDAMPRSAAQTGMTDFILPPAEMPRHLVRYLERSIDGLDAENLAEAIPENDLEKAFFILRTVTGHDFLHYKRNTMLRRIKRRMDLHQMDSLTEYVLYLAANPKETRELFRDLLIGVTNFFRDPEAFEALKNMIMAGIEKKPQAGTSLRAWVPGCSSGEEAYSLAIMIKECLLETKKDVTVQIYATDLDETAIETARQGEFPENIAADVSDNRLQSFFMRTDKGFRINNEIREMLVFAPQNILRDPPFSRLDIICCRNLLIYFDAVAQKKALSLFHYALAEGGLLFLGTSESIGEFGDLFAQADRKWRIYHRKPSLTDIASTGAGLFADNRFLPMSRTGIVLDPKVAAHPADAQILVEQFLLRTCVPPSALITPDGEILYIHGRTGTYLEPPSGKPVNNILAMAREELKADLAAAIRDAATRQADVFRKRLPLKIQGKNLFVDMAVRWMLTGKNDLPLLIVSFQNVAGKAKRKPAHKGSEEEQRSTQAQELENELQRMRENLRTVVEEYQTANEEMKSTNEELQSANEELQSSNEELETAKEELQSINEEQSTLNSELQNKIEALNNANNDMANLMAGTNIATLFLDNALRIKRFTPEIRGIFNLIPTDVGRPLSHIASNLLDDEILDAAAQTLETLQVKESETLTKDGTWLQMRIRPYRTIENVIDGVILTFNDITALKRSEQRAGEAQKLAENVVDAVREPLLILERDLTVSGANPAYYRVFQTTPGEILGRSVYELDEGRLDVPALRRLLEDLTVRDAVFDNYEIDGAIHDLEDQHILVNARKITGEQLAFWKILLAFWISPRILK